MFVFCCAMALYGKQPQKPIKQGKKTVYTRKSDYQPLYTGFPDNTLRVLAVYGAVGKRGKEQYAGHKKLRKFQDPVT